MLKVVQCLLSAVIVESIPHALIFVCGICMIEEYENHVITSHSVKPELSGAHYLQMLINVTSGSLLEPFLSFQSQSPRQKHSCLCGSHTKKCSSASR